MTNRQKAIDVITNALVLDYTIQYCESHSLIKSQECPSQLLASNIRNGKEAIDLRLILTTQLYGEKRSGAGMNTMEF
eukprot:scaffold15397_cov93-Cylindrotheca_fusiformis.AAC.1